MKNYKTQSYKYLFITIACLTPIVLFVTFFLWLQINMALGNGNGDLFVIIMFLAIELVFIRFACFFVTVFGSSVFSINFYSNKFQFKRIFRNKTFYYKDVDSLTEISSLTGFIQNREGQIRIIEIKFKNKKTILILIKALVNEKEKGLRYDLEKYINMPMELTYRSIYSIK